MEMNRLTSREVLIFLMAVFSIFAARAFAEDLTADQIVDRANKVAYYEGDDGRADVKMTITDAQGRIRARKFVILRKDEEDGGDQKFFVYFKRPVDVKKTVFMVWKHIGKDDDRWLYLPALDLVKRIAASDKRSSFVGSNFLYEDVSGRGVDEDTHELVETTDQFFVINNIPKKPEEVEFSSYKVWIDKKTFMPMKAEYQDREGEKYRIVEALVLEDIQGHPTVTKSRVEDLKSKGNTISEFTNIVYDIGLEDNLFTERYLRRAPKKWLK